jgi:hypothetical protein
MRMNRIRKTVLLTVIASLPMGLGILKRKIIRPLSPSRLIKKHRRIPQNSD